jgi:hypothetical protein
MTAKHIILKCFIFLFSNLSWQTKDHQPQVKTFSLCLWHFLEIWAKQGFCSLFCALLLVGCWHGRWILWFLKGKANESELHFTNNASKEWNHCLHLLGLVIAKLLYHVYSPGEEYEMLSPMYIGFDNILLLCLVWNSSIL